jgi:hypothetical protein
MRLSELSPVHHALAQPAVADLKRKSVVGGVAALSAQGVKFVVQTTTTMVLARLLSPEDFGLQGTIALGSDLVFNVLQAGGRDSALLKHLPGSVAICFQAEGDFCAIAARNASLAFL